MPRLLLGAEVQYFDGMDHLRELPSLCIQGTNLLLLEMPFDRWDQRVIQTVQEIQRAGEIQLVLAHVERYLSFYRNPQALEAFRRAGVLMQVNASFFDGWLRRRKALSMLQSGAFQLMGSDCHNLTSRRPNWDLVPQEVQKTLGRVSRNLLRQHSIL